MNLQKPIETLATVFPALDRLGSHLRRKEIPYIEQTMATDCGAASLAMALGFHGHHVELDEVRQVLQVTRDGVSARAIVEAAQKFNLDARGVKVGIDDLVHLPRGSVLHWEFSHFLVFDRIDGDRIHLVDPAMGPRVITRDEGSKSITGVAIVLEPRAGFSKKKKAESVIVRYMRAALAGSQDWGRIAMVSLTIEGLTILLPLITGRLVDRVLPRNDIHLLYVLLGAFTVSGIFYFLASLVRGHLLLHLKTRFDTKMTMGFVRHVLRLPYDFFELRQPADLQMRVQSIQSIRETLTGALLSGGLDGVMVIAHLVFLAAMSTRMLGIAVVIVAVEGGLYVLTRKRLRELSSDVLAKQTTASNALQELLSGIESLKAGGVEQRAAQTWANNYVDVLNVNLRRGATQATCEAVLGFLKVAGPVLLLVIGIVDVMEKRMSIGTMLSANAMAVGFIMPTMNLINTLQNLQQARAQLMRIEDVVNTDMEQGSEHRMMAPPLSGQISLERVSFRYGPKLPLALRDVSLTIKPGEMVALVGRSGSGKSTLGRMLAGLYNPGEGHVSFDGMPLSQLDLQSVRQQLGVVVQRAHVFGTTVRANIALGEPGIPLQQVQDAAKQACIHEDIQKLPMGYDTPIIAGGSSLSGGQRQRIALARALVNKPAVILLDEATSALDAVTEHQVTQNLDALKCTRIVIAHRLSTVVNADRIIVMEQGELVEMGTHAELVAKGGFYAKLVESQLGVNASLQAAPAPVVQASAPPPPVPAPAPVVQQEQPRRSAPPPLPSNRRSREQVPANVMSFEEVRARRQRRDADPMQKAVGAGAYAPFHQAWDDAEADAQAYYDDPRARSDHGHDPRYAGAYDQGAAQEYQGVGYDTHEAYNVHQEQPMRDASELPTEMNYRSAPREDQRSHRRRG